MEAFKATLLFAIATSLVPTGYGGCICPAVYAPVCGSNGRTYTNKCKLNCETKHNPRLKLAYKGKCGSNSEKGCDCRGGKIARSGPVCGSDGKTYANKCQLGCAKKTKKSLRQKSRGPCKPKLPGSGSGEQECICMTDYNPVCGSDEKTYNNPCLLGCAQKQDKLLHKKSEGTCKTKLPDSGSGEQECNCMAYEDIVCGSDRKTYNNPCLLACAQRNDKSLKLASAGACKDFGSDSGSGSGSGSGSDSSEEGCNCMQNFQPVCGSDGKTYGNDCELNCSKKKENSLSKVGEGACVVEHVTPLIDTLLPGPCGTFEGCNED